MTKRDELLAAIRHEEGIVPSWTMAFFNTDLARKLLGADNVVTDVDASAVYKTGRADDDNRRRNILYSRAVDNCAIGIGQGSNFAFGHGGPGEMMQKIIETGDDYVISMYETGVKRLTKWNPHFYHHFDYPLETLDDVPALILPDAAKPARYTGLADDARFYREAGYLPYANLNGIFSGIHYYIYPYDKLFMDMLLDKENMHLLIQKLARFNLTAAENLLRSGAEMITTCDDLGDGRSLLFSPALYDEYFAPYHAELADLCHSYNAYLHVHSHGNIWEILPKLVATGIDLLNPFDPYEVGELSAIKEQFGQKITIVGGMDKFFFEFDKDKMRAFLTEVIQTGRKGGGFILMDSGGIPENVTKESYDYIRELSRSLRYGS